MSNLLNSAAQALNGIAVNSKLLSHLGLRLTGNDGSHKGSFSGRIEVRLGTLHRGFSFAHFVFAALPLEVRVLAG